MTKWETKSKIKYLQSDNVTKNKRRWISSLRINRHVWCYPRHNSRSREKAKQRIVPKSSVRRPPSPEFHCYFAASEGSYSVCSQAVFSLSHFPLPRVPFSLSHFPVGCYCRVSSPSLIKSFVLRRGRHSPRWWCSAKYPGEYFENKRRLVFSSCASSPPRQIHIKAV